MNVHFIIGLVLLLLIIGLMYLYALVPLVLIIVIRTVKRCYSYYKLRQNERLAKLPIWFEQYDKWMALTLLVIVLFVNIGIYTNQRQRWMGPDNANFKAKEYYVVGQVVCFHRKVIAAVLNHPDAFHLIVPFTSLQRLIYKIGIRQLPEQDAEIAVWAEQWFVYIYSMRNKLASKPFLNRTLDEDKFQSQDGQILSKEEALRGEVPLLPKKNDFMDLVWFCLETMATKDFADHEMKEHHYLRNYAGMAQYYAYMSPKSYTKLFLNTQSFYAQMPTMTTRNENLVDWLNELPAKWRQSEEITAFIQKHPKVEAMRQMAQLMTLVNIFDARIWAKDFACQDPYLNRLLEVRQEFSQGLAGEIPAYQRMTDKRTANQFYEIAVNSHVARFTNFVMLKYCGEALAGEEDMRGFEGRAISPAAARRREIRNLFSHELKLLNMTDVLEEKYLTR